ncbi:MAG: hypothetical protein A4S09_08035 [Proteobacteria bacterium SG_bin7]|nr:MAG: hypothetical protein A4S09_08035 [Proteobacteria bacterium SG_bin7]
MINVNGLLEAFDSDWDLIRELVTLCQEKVPEYVGNIKTAADAKNFSQLEHHAHKLKGSIAHFGCQEFYDCVYQLEVAGREHKSDSIPGLMDTLEQEFKSFEAGLRELSQKANSR